VGDPLFSLEKLVSLEVTISFLEPDQEVKIAEKLENLRLSTFREFEMYDIRDMTIRIRDMPEIILTDYKSGIRIALAANKIELHTLPYLMLDEPFKEPEKMEFDEKILSKLSSILNVTLGLVLGISKEEIPSIRLQIELETKHEDYTEEFSGLFKRSILDELKNIGSDLMVLGTTFCFKEEDVIHTFNFELDTEPRLLTSTFESIYEPFVGTIDLNGVISKSLEHMNNLFSILRR